MTIEELRTLLNAYAGQYSGLNDKIRTFVRAERGGCSNE
jgi:hypothetical protein